MFLYPSKKGENIPSLLKNSSEEKIGGVIDNATLGMDSAAALEAMLKAGFAR